MLGYRLSDHVRVHTMCTLWRFEDLLGHPFHEPLQPGLLCPGISMIWRHCQRYRAMPSQMERFGWGRPMVPDQINVGGSQGMEIQFPRRALNTGGSP
jgi:hypothetical protein